MAKDSANIHALHLKIDDLRRREQELEADLSALFQGVLGLMENRPTTYLAGKLRDRRIRKATDTLNEGKEALISIKSLLHITEVQLRFALDVNVRRDG